VIRLAHIIYPLSLYDHTTILDMPGGTGTAYAALSGCAQGAAVGAIADMATAGSSMGLGAASGCVAGAVCSVAHYKANKEAKKGTDK
jgi:hypothetical protein